MAFDNSIAHSINIHGQVVGTAFYYEDGGAVSRAVLFVDDKAYDLNDLVDAHELVLTGAFRIADNGAIAAYGSGAAYRPVVLIPTGAPLAPDRSWRHRVGTVIASDQRAAALAIDAMNVYWVTTNVAREVAIKTIEKTGGPVKTLWSRESGYSNGNLLADDGYVWLQLSTCRDTACSKAEHGIWRVSKIGGVAQRMAEGWGQFAVSDSTIYSRRFSRNDTELIATRKAGGQPVVHATNPGPFALDGNELFFFKTVQLSAGGTWTLHVLCVESSGRVTELTGPWDIQWGRISVDARSIFIREARRIVRIPRSGGQVRVLANIPSSMTGSPPDLYMHGGFLYWNQHAEGGQPACIARMPKDGGDPTCLDSGFWQYRAVGSDDTAVFYARDMEIVRLAK